MDYRVREALNLFERGFSHKVSLEEVARALNLSPSRLRHVFKEETGLPPMRYVRLLRMRQARTLLETSYLSVKEIVARVGGADESHFLRDFKKAYGMTPTQLRAHAFGPPGGRAATSANE